MRIINLFWKSNNLSITFSFHVSDLFVLFHHDGVINCYLTNSYSMRQQVYNSLRYAWECKAKLPTFKTNLSKCHRCIIIATGGKLLQYHYPRLVKIKGALWSFSGAHNKGINQAGHLYKKINIFKSISKALCVSCLPVHNCLSSTFMQPWHTAVHAERHLYSKQCICWF